MGYNIYYEGKIQIDKLLDEETYNIITGLSETRRIRWDVDKLEADGIAKKEDIGEWGEFFFGHMSMKEKQLREFENKYASKILSPPPGQPSYYSPWIITEDRMGLEWNRGEKSYAGHEWLQYIVKKILVPMGYYPSGIINWFTEECLYVGCDDYYDNVSCDEWHTIVNGKSVRKYKRYNPKQKEPDIEAWFQEEHDLYEKYHQEWIGELINNKVEFLHERIASVEDNTLKKSVLSFNLFIENDVVQATYDGESITGIRYLYKNIRNEDGRKIYDEFKSDDETVKDIKVIKMAKELIEKYICETPNYLDKAVI